jgi:hypothetical protein
MTANAAPDDREADVTPLSSWIAALRGDAIIAAEHDEWVNLSKGTTFAMLAVIEAADDYADNMGGLHRVRAALAALAAATT